MWDCGQDTGKKNKIVEKLVKYEQGLNFGW